MENVFFQQAGVAVTNSRFIVGSQTYAMRNITSVKPVRYQSSGATLGPLLSISGLLLIVLGVKESSFGLGVLGFLIAGGGCFWFKVQRPTFGIILATSGGEVRVLQHDDREFIENIIAALNNSIVSHA